MLDADAAPDEPVCEAGFDPLFAGDRGVLLGGTIAWLGRSRGVSPHDGCADAAFGAIVLLRTVEGILVAGVYAGSAALGLLGLALLAVHAIGETVAIGGSGHGRTGARRLRPLASRPPRTWNVRFITISK